MQCTHLYTTFVIYIILYKIIKYNILYIYFDAPFDDAVCCERLQSLLLSKSPAENVFPFIGFKWWELYDSNREVTNWGLVTRLGNAYDGVQARTGVQACTAEDDLADAVAAERVEEARHEAEAIQARVIPGAQQTLREVRAG